jgi:1,4-dihydroxy-2-naphthoate polyprenyltransferase
VKEDAMAAVDISPDARSAAPIRPGSARAWVLACRPVTLTAAVVPVLVGVAVARTSGAVRVLPALAALVGAILIQIATNFANDVFDHEKGADTAERLGPTRATQSGLLSARQVRSGMLVVVALAVLVGGYLAAVAGWPIVAIGVASIASGVAYTAGPYPLGYHGLGDVFVFLFFGFVAVLGTAFVAIGAVPPVAWIAALPVGAIATAVLVVNNVRDRATDVVAGKRTLAVRFGRAAAIGEYVALLLVAYAAPVGIAALLGSAWPLLPLATAPIAVRLVASLRGNEGKALNPVLASTAKLLLAHGVLLAAGLALTSKVG